jgi:hypothetical protein
MMKALKKIAVSVGLLALGMVLGAVLVGPADIVQGQAEAQLFSVAYPPSPCDLAVESRIVFAADGTATAKLIAWPPSPCAPSLNLDIVSFPEDAARCVEVDSSERVAVVECEFATGHQTTTFYFNSNARD